MTTPIRCVCGTTVPPRSIRRGPASLLMSMECPACKRRTPVSRVEHLDIAWATMQAIARKQLREREGEP